MNVKQIIEFLNHRRGYLKEGKKRLQQVLAKQGFKVTLNDCEEALSHVRAQMRAEKQYREETGNNANFKSFDNDNEVAETVPSNLKVKSAWQGPDGRMLYSYTAEYNMEEPLIEFRKELLEDLSKIKRPNYKDAVIQHSEGYVLEISLPDLHFGKGDTNELKQNFFNAIINLTEKCGNLPITKIILPIGNDGMNSEGMRGTTTKGTPQIDTIPWFDSFRIYAKTLMEAIEYLKVIAPVEVVVVQGNHDFERMFYMGELIAAYYEKDDMVTVNNDTHPRKFVHFGKVLIMYTHGDNEKPNTLPLIMATERPVEFALSAHRETHCGHFHKEMVVEEVRGIKTRFMPSICTNDEWHKKMGYESYRSAQAILWHPERGLEALLQYNV